ncbi:ABC transporter permease [Magnetovibrio blakemorei]|uniref:Transport permease protein n=1 Tax=Magnetovibrio blakemorei TaxID=28181 RepID=A0A1E5QB80_9PROT|nr:ABC transporter permease [Magnetovibrio blakemorei]OEJ69227.1 multidrug ABC transporter permease [Magnetovibrio blakemorei]
MQQTPASNWIGLYTLYMREVRRFVKVYTQTIIGPVVTTLLFLAVFSLALGRAVTEVHGVPFMQFLAPGLIMMAIVQNAFANTSSSMMISKVQGNIVDTLMPSLSAHELTFGIAMGGMTRGILVGIAVTLVLAIWVPISIHHVGFVLFHAVAASLMLSLLGVIGGIWSDKFDHIAAVTNFIITPLSFLSGTFYSIERLPELAQTIARVNPFFYMIDGFRYGFIGNSDASVVTGMAVVGIMDLVLWIICWRMFESGYKLKP